MFYDILIFLGYILDQFVLNLLDVYLQRTEKILELQSTLYAKDAFILQVMELVVKEKLVSGERRISLSEFHTADEV